MLSKGSASLEIKQIGWRSYNSSGYSQDFPARAWGNRLLTGLREQTDCSPACKDSWILAGEYFGRLDAMDPDFWRPSVSPGAWTVNCAFAFSVHPIRLQRTNPASLLTHILLRSLQLSGTPPIPTVLTATPCYPWDRTSLLTMFFEMQIHSGHLVSITIVTTLELNKRTLENKDLGDFLIFGQWLSLN